MAAPSTKPFSNTGWIGIDSAPGLAAAKGAGLFTLITPSYRTQSQDFTAADWVLPSLSERGYSA